MNHPSGLRRFGPWTEVTRAQARALSGSGHLLTVVDGEENWGAAAGFHFVNALSYFQSTHALPSDLMVDDVWLDEAGGPVIGDE